jgi:hypothetical protein
MCTVLLSPGVNPIAVKYILSYSISELRSSGLLCNKWQFRTDVSGQTIGTIFNAQESKKKARFMLDFFLHEYGTDRLSRNVGKEFPLLVA